MILLGGVCLVDNSSTYNKSLVTHSATTTTESEKEYTERLARAEVSLRQWIDFREVWSRKGKSKFHLQKKQWHKQQEAIGR
jgi:uncharacterized protein YukE